MSNVDFAFFHTTYSCRLLLEYAFVSSSIVAVIVIAMVVYVHVDVDICFHFQFRYLRSHILCLYYGAAVLSQYYGAGFMLWSKSQN